MGSFENDCAFYNQIFGNHKGIIMSSEFVFNNQKQLYTAKIILYRGDNQYYFYVLIPQDYPYGDVKFIPETLSGYPHQNFDGSICLNVPFVDNLYSKIRFDIDKLIDWVDIYVENQKQDDFYEYTPADYDDRILFVF